MTPVFIQIALIAVTLKQDALLRSGCDPDSESVGQAHKGEAAEIRFAVAGSAVACYKVATASGTGYLTGDVLDGLDRFDRDRNAASADVASVKVTRAEVDTVQRRVSAAVEGQGAVAAAARLIEAGQPHAALGALARELQRPNPSADALTLAGVAEWRADDPKAALRYWKSALDLRPDPTLAGLYAKVEREAAGDRSGQKTVGTRVNLRYEGENVSPGLAREMIEILDLEYARVAAQLGCRAEEKITAIVQSREAYFKTTGAAEWSGGRYDGKIRVALIDAQRGVGAQTRRAFAHELVHACLHQLGSWPLWFHEGMAQRLSGDSLSPAMKSKLAEMARAGTLPSFDFLGQGWGQLSSEQAWAAYALSLRAADRFSDRAANLGLRYVLANPPKFAELEAEIARQWTTP